MIEPTGFKNHIWDNVLSKLSNHPSSKKPSQRKQFHFSGPSHIPSNTNSFSPSTTVEILEIERKFNVTKEEFYPPHPKPPKTYPKCLDTSATPFFCTTKNFENLNVRPKYEKVQKIKQAGKQCMATDEERKNAPQPKSLANWKYTPDLDNITYDARAASDAFEEYAMRMRAKRLQRETKKDAENQQKSRRREIARNCEHVRVNRRPSEQKQRPARLEKTVQMRNIRDDEVSIVKYEKQCEEGEEQESVVPPVKNRKPAAFYGTIEAQTCASHAAEQISKACENLKRLQFVAEEAYPNGVDHLKTLDQIGIEIRDFHAQVRSHRASVPKNMNMNASHVAHFVLE